MNKTRILLVDDEPAVLLALKLLLQALGCEVTDFSAPIPAVEHLGADTNYDLVICDLKMPNLTGLEVLERAKQLNPALPFILMSGHAQQDDIEQARQQGIDGFLPKPFSTLELREVLQLAGVPRAVAALG